MVTMNMTAEIWEQITSKALGKVATFFTGKEVGVITDFIQTAKEDVKAIIEEFPASSGD